MSPRPDFRARCRLLRAATLLVFLVLALLLGSGATGSVWLAHGGSAGDPAQLRLLLLVGALPGLGYLWALWALQRGLADVASGRLFEETVATAMRRMGAGVLAGAVMNVALVVNLSRWIAGGRGSYLYFDLSGIVLGVVGVSLVLLAHVVDEARSNQAELDGIV